MKKSFSRTKANIKTISKSIYKLTDEEVNELLDWIKQKKIDIPMDDKRNLLKSSLESSIEGDKEPKKIVFDSMVEKHPFLKDILSVTKKVQKPTKKDELTKLQKDILKRILLKIDTKPNGLTAGDLVTPSNSIYRIGAVITTLIEKDLIEMETIGSGKTKRKIIKIL